MRWCLTAHEWPPLAAFLEETEEEALHSVLTHQPRSVRLVNKQGTAKETSLLTITNVIGKSTQSRICGSRYSDTLRHIHVSINETVVHVHRCTYAELGMVVFERATTSDRIRNTVRGHCGNTRRAVALLENTCLHGFRLHSRLQFRCLPPTAA